MNENIGAYRILQECGHGSYGTVYLAESTLSGRRVALKILDGKREARELEGLIRYRECRHANLIQIHHLDRLPDGRLYYTMDAADDRGTDGTYRPDTLAARGKIPAPELLPIVRALLDGAAELHKNKLIHRDIKPENILFVNRVPVLGDIGLTARDGDASMIGTPSFLPPEVLSGSRAPDAASDLYALGRVAYVALTGYPPHKYPQIPKELSPDAAPVLAFCRAASAANATLGSCRAALDIKPRKRSRYLLAALALFAAVIATAITVLSTQRRRGTAPQMLPAMSHGAAPASLSRPAATLPRKEAEDVDAALANCERELDQKMRQLDTDIAAAQKKMRAGLRVLTSEEYRAAVAELENRYPVPPELLQRAKARYDAVRQEQFRKQNAPSPSAADEGWAPAKREVDLRQLENRDALYRLGSQDSSLKFHIRSFEATRHGSDLTFLEQMFRERRTTADQLQKP